MSRVRAGRVTTLALAALLCLFAGAAQAKPQGDLTNAVFSNDVAKATTALDAGADPNGGGKWPLLNRALEARSERLAQLLLTRGADPDQQGYRGVSALSLLSPIVARVQNETLGGGLLPALVYAANASSLCARELTAETVRLVIAGAATVDLPDAKGRTALMQAAGCGHLRTMTMLLDAGANLEAATPEGETALAFAVAGGRPAAVLALAQRGAKLDVRMKGGDGLLHLAARGAGPTQVEAAKGLLQHKPALDARNDAGDTPLILAARNETGAEMAKLLLEAGADRAIANGKGETAAGVARGPTAQLLAATGP